VSRFHAAESLLSAIHDTLDAQLGDFHPFTQHARSLLARLYQAWGRPEPAAPVQSDATEDR